MTWQQNIHAAVEESRTMQLLQTEAKRFVDVESRPFQSLLFEQPNLGEYFDTIQRAKWVKNKWKGRTLVKDPCTQSIYLQLMQDLLPRTILEFGTDEGGSAIWLSDVMQSLDVECDVHTFDIDVDRIDVPPHIAVHHMDNHHVRAFVAQHRRTFEELRHPILVIEDSHENFEEVLETFDAFLETGDYVVVEDTLDQSKHRGMISFASGRYEVDTYYCDFWGLNNSWNVNSFLVKK